MATKEKYYETKITLDTPYKWGIGYEKATQEEIESNEQAIKQTLLSIGFKIEPKESDYSCDSYYNPNNRMEEIFAHPMELSGVMTQETRDMIVEHLKRADYPYTKIWNGKVEVLTDDKEVFDYENIDIVNVLSKLTDNDIRSLGEAHIYNIDKCLSFLGLKMKRYCFVPYIDKKVKTQKSFIETYIRERLAKLGL